MAADHQLTDLGAAVDQVRPLPRHPVDEQADRTCAAYRVLARALDAADARQLLDMLGLDPADDTA